MRIKVKRSFKLSGCIAAPSSKSHSIRGIFLALLARGVSRLINILDSDDVKDAIRVCQSFGARVIIDGKQLTLSSPDRLVLNETSIYTGNSGLTTCFTIPLLGLRLNNDVPIIVDCGEQMRFRPIQPLLNALMQLGLNIVYLKQYGMLPISVSGSLAGGVAVVDGVISQYLSALLIALPYATQDSLIFVKNLREIPYVNMTLDWIMSQHIQLSSTIHNDTYVYSIQGNQRYKHLTVTINGDFSSASYIIAAAILTGGCVKLMSLNMQDSQGDKQLITILRSMGAEIHIDETYMIVSAGNVLHGIAIDVSDTPDLLPILAVIGTHVTGITRIYNARQARIKETDRINSIVSGLRLLGAKIDEYDDGLTVYQSQLVGTMVSGHDDHRTIMALSVAGMIATGVTIIDGASVSKSYPEYIRDMRSIGAEIEVIV
jgi:3-phosphoshikimate 1-carboxyvinyltransferase